MAKRNIAGGRALVTGASSGIGREVARELARRGARVLVTARRRERLAELVGEIADAGGDAGFLAGDIADAAFRQQLLEEARRRFRALDMLVNNAGVGAFGPFAAAGPERLRRVMEVNFFAPAETIREALPLLRSGRRPLIVNVGSVLGHFAAPDKAEYCASKFALHGLSDAIRIELAAEKIDVLLVSPSTTQSEFFDRPLENESTRRPRSLRVMSARAAARKTVRAMARGRREIILSLSGKAAVALDRLAPRLMDYLMARLG